MSGKKKIIILAALATTATAVAQDYIESFSHNSDFRGSERTMQYAPTLDGYIASKNGKNLYTRALYGGHSLWRLETSDFPIFAAYHKKDNRNIHFTVTADGRTTRLDSVADCIAMYRGGERVYRLSDPAWGKGKITLTTVAAHDDEAAYWKVDAKNMPKNGVLTMRSCPTVKIKLNRSGDMGADPANCFAPDPEATDGISESSFAIGGKSREVYAGYAEREVTFADQKKLKSLFDKAAKDNSDLRGRLKISTPDPYINTLGASLAAAGDGIWDGLTYQHGAVGWRMPLSGWRGAYTGDFLGWHDRARTHFDAYAASQVTEVPPTIPHPAQDSTMNLARAEKKWGTQMYSNGYICRNPQKNNVMHHYDMNLCYIDELLWHLQWTGDTAYARQIWPVIERSLEWEKRNFDPDDDGLYDAYCCIWASDALYYNSGAVTHSSAYNYRANSLAATIADIIGMDSTPYREEAEKILEAMNSTLWMDDKGTWAEFKDKMGNGNLHTHPGVWTIYHAIDGGTATPEQAYRATRYIDANIPHIQVEADGLDSSGYEVVSTTDWMPYAWSINNVAFAEIYNTALAYWQAGRADEAFRLMKSAMMDGMFIGNSPGNIGQISHYDAARGECYRDFADPVGMMSRAVVEGLFGFSPELMSRKITLRPGFPSQWKQASIEHPDFTLTFESDADASDIYTLKLSGDMASMTDSISLVLPLKYEKETVIVNGKKVDFRITDEDKPYQALLAKAATGGADKMEITVQHSGERIIAEDTEAHRFHDIPELLCVNPVDGASRPIDISAGMNDNVKAIFHNRYESPRSPYTTLQLPVNGIGEWCHPKDSAYIDDSYIRDKATITIAKEAIGTGNDLVFDLAPADKNVGYVSLYDNYPDSIVFPASGAGKALALLMAGSTNHMQAYTANAKVEVRYADGTSETVLLVPPYNWAPIEQDYFIDGKAFALPTDRQLRMKLTDGTVSRDLGKSTGIEGVYGRRIEGGAANLLFVPLNAEKQLESILLKAEANEVVIGLIAASLITD